MYLIIILNVYYQALAILKTMAMYYWVCIVLFIMVKQLDNIINVFNNVKENIIH